MVNSENKDEKKEKIIQAALQRFAHFGQAKTSMQEIADDLDISKASLYYYFPDKRALSLAVLQHVGGQYFNDLRKEVARGTSAAECLKNANKVGHHYLREFERIGLFEIFQSISETGEQDEEMQKARLEVITIFTSLIEKGVKQHEWAVENPAETAELYLDAMHGLRLGLFYKNTGRVTQGDQKLLEVLFKKGTALTELFIKGMKKS